MGNPRRSPLKKLNSCSNGCRSWIQQFGEAVDLAIQMPRPSLQHTRILARLETDKTWEKHPEGCSKVIDFSVGLQYTGMVSR